MKTKEITAGKKIVFDNGDRYRTIHIEFAKTVTVGEDEDDAEVEMALIESIDANLAVRAIESRFGDRFSKEKLNTLSKIEAAEKEIASFLKSIGLGNCKVEL